MEMITGLAAGLLAGALALGAWWALGLPSDYKYPITGTLVFFGYLAGRASHAQHP